MEWISAKDRLPEENIIEEVIIFLTGKEGNKMVFPATWRCNKFMYFNGEYHTIQADITHWMPLPEPPKTLNQ